MMKSPYEQDPVVSSFYQPLDSDAASPSPFGPKPFQPKPPEYGQQPNQGRKPMEVRGSLSWTEGQGGDPIVDAFHDPMPAASAPQPMHVASAATANGPDQTQNPDPNPNPNPNPDPNQGGGGPDAGASNPGVDEATWQTAQRWGADPEYSWILSNPWAIGEYYQYAAEQQAKGETDIDAVDFFAARGYQSPKAGRAGRDTMKFRADGTARESGLGTPDDGGKVHMPQTGGNPDPNKDVPGEQEQEIPFVINNPDAEAYWRTRGGAPKPPGTEDANIAASWYRTFPVDEAEKITAEDVTRYRTSGVNMNFGDWWQKVDRIQRDSYGGRNNPGLGGPDGQGPGKGGVQTAMPPAPELVKPPAPEAPVDPPPEIHKTGGVDPAFPNPEGGPDDGATTQHKTGGVDPAFPPSIVPPGPGGGGPDDVVKAIKSLNDMFAPGFESEQKQLLRAMMHAGGVSGMSDSGGFASSVGDKMSGLIANQGQRMGDYAFKDKHDRDALTMQKYIADQENRTRLKELETNSGMQKYIADLNNDLERYKVNTNADLEKMLAEQENTLKRYGIDKGDVLERYKADLQLKGIVYSSDAQVSASGLNAAAAGAAGAAAGAARAAEAEMEYKLGMARLGQENTFNQRQYDLGVYGINRDIYQTDIDNQYKMMMLQWYMSPEARMGGGAPNLPGMTPYP